MEAEVTLPLILSPRDSDSKPNKNSIVGIVLYS